MTSAKQQFPSKDVEVIDRPQLARMIIMLLCTWTACAMTVYRAVVNPKKENWECVFWAGMFASAMHIVAAQTNITKTVLRPIVPHPSASADVCNSSISTTGCQTDAT